MASMPFFGFRPRFKVPHAAAGRACGLLLGVLALSLAGVSTTGCGGPEAKTALGYSADAKRAYESALAEFDAHNWIECQQMFREVKRKYSYSRYARLAELRLADADFAQDKFAEAIRGYKQFVHDHRSDQDEVTYARSRIAEAQYKEISESLLLPSIEERDQGATLEAYKEMRGFLHDFPAAKQSKKVCDLLEDVTVKLVRHELYVARFYLRTDNFDATVWRVQYALRNYASEPPCQAHVAKRASTEVEGGNAAGAIEDDDSATRTDFGLAPEALLLLGETYLKMHRWTDARAAFVAILQRYPESALIVQAKSYLDFMQTQGV
jgi:outer membrane protein assembly factor BamD